MAEVVKRRIGGSAAPTDSGKPGYSLPEDFHPTSSSIAPAARSVVPQRLKFAAIGVIVFVLGYCFWISQVVMLFAADYNKVLNACPCMYAQLDAQGMMVEIMQCEQKLLKSLNITFYIDEGTLLGAVRTGGYHDEYDREDVDWSIMSTDTDYLYRMRHLSYERCGFPMVHRSDRQWMPNWLPLVCRRSAFRIFYGYMYPYFYLDIRDYDIVDGHLIDLHNVDDADTGNFPLVRPPVAQSFGNRAVQHMY